MSANHHGVGRIDGTASTERAVVVAVFGACSAAAAVAFVSAPGAALELAGAMSVSMIGVGKFLPLWGVSGQSRFGPWELGLLVWVMDTLAAVAVLYGHGVLCRLSFVRRALSRVQRGAGLVLDAYPRVRRCAIAGVVAFVVFPVTGTGAVVGSFLGLLLGLDRRTVIAAVSAGGLLGGLSMAFFAVYFGAGVMRVRDMQQHVAVKYLVLAVAVGLGVAAFALLSRAYRRALARALATAPHTGAK